MEYSEASKIINKLMESDDNNYFVDFVPFTFPNENYWELEEYLEDEYKSEYAKKITFVAFMLIYYYECNIFLDEVDLPIYPDLEKKDLRNIGLDKLEAIIQKMIVENYSGLNIIINHNENKSLMRIEDGYNTIFFNIEGSCFNIVQQLINHQGIFLNKLTKK